MAPLLKGRLARRPPPSWCCAEGSGAGPGDDRGLARDHFRPLHGVLRPPLYWAAAAVEGAWPMPRAGWFACAVPPLRDQGGGNGGGERDRGIKRSGIRRTRSSCGCSLRRRIAKEKKATGDSRGPQVSYFFAPCSLPIPRPPHRKRVQAAD